MMRLKDLAVAASTALVLLACSGGAEEQLLSRFFVSCRSGDSTTVANISLVEFPGICESWEIVEIGPETNEPFRVPELRGQLTQAMHERDMQYEKGKVFLEDNYASIEKIQIELDANPDHQFESRLSEIRSEWMKIIQERKDRERRVQDLRRELDRELKIVSMALMSSPRIEGLEGSVTTKKLLLKVRTGSKEKPYAFVLQKYDLVNEEENIAPASRWIIVDIQERTT